MKYNFHEVTISSMKKGICSVCGKSCQRSKTFSQTINPFNKNKKGEIKTGNEIRIELEIEIDNWKKLPIKHSKCE